MDTSGQKNTFGESLKRLSKPHSKTQAKYSTLRYNLTAFSRIKKELTDTLSNSTAS
jgi:hypothetical protein